MRSVRRTILMMLALSLAGTVGAEHTDTMGVGIGGDRADALAYLAEQHERRARSEALHALRRSLTRFEDTGVARVAGYAPTGVCIAGSDGGLGVPFALPGAPAALAAPEAVDAAPHTLTYEPRSDGTLALVGAQYAVLRDAWHAAGWRECPSFLGEPFVLVDHLFDEPAYVLFVWLRPNPARAFTAWHPQVQCREEVDADDDTGASLEPRPHCGSRADGCAAAATTSPVRTREATATPTPARPG